MLKSLLCTGKSHDPISQAILAALQGMVGGRAEADRIREPS